ncbi:MAG: hypothetical protein IH892_07950 [Planctomycetes bacterium]|nr:hypothetical protein [Planctomycetota bacterium]
MTSTLISRALPSLALAIVTAVIYLGAKYMFGGLTELHLWLALTFGIIVGHSLPWRKRGKAEHK